MIASVHIADVGTSRGLRLVRHRPDPASVPGLRNADLGLAAPLRGDGGPPAPQLGRVALFAFWDDDAAIDAFEASHALAVALADGWHARLAPLRAHGTWPGLPGDVPASRDAEGDDPVVVFTLARLRLSQAVRFFRSSGRAEKAAHAADGLVWATACAQPFRVPPFLATCSVWRSAQASATYAFGRRDPGHPDAIDSGRAKPFHHQEAFIRFRPYTTRGGLEGRNPFPAATAHLA